MFKKIYFFIWMSIFIYYIYIIYYVDHLCAWCSQSPQERALEPLEQELKVGISSVDTGNSA